LEILLNRFISKESEPLAMARALGMLFKLPPCTSTPQVANKVCSVGAGGLTLHGGYGFSSHTHGLTLDNLVEAQVVLANSSVVTASKTENPDLFWALRGAGSSFGVVTNFKYQTFPAPDNNIVFSYTLQWSQQQAKDNIKALQDFAINQQPLELNLRIFINSFSTTLSGVYYGSQANFATAMAPLASKYGISTAVTGGGFFNSGPSVKGWLDTLTANSNGALSTAFDYDTHETFVSFAVFIDGFSVI
jgi:hypothetical protein